MTANTQPQKGVSTPHTIEDNGQWNWSLSVKGDGVVRASKAIPYDGTRAFSTKDARRRRSSRTSRRIGSESGLSAEEVVDRYVRHAQTDRTKAELLEQVDEVRR